MLKKLLNKGFKLLWITDSGKNARLWLSKSSLIHNVNEMTLKKIIITNYKLVIFTLITMLLTQTKKYLI